ncbi:MAG TPA: HD domain-containing phosphohydrolase, partial [Candidatus Xenobia bacterium]
MHEPLAHSDGINTDLLKTLHDTVGRGLGMAYLLCDARGSVLYHHLDRSDSAVQVLLDADQLNERMLALIQRQLAAGDSGEVRKVALVPGVLWSAAVAVPGPDAEGAFVFAGPFQARTPLEGDLDKCAAKLKVACDKSFRTSMSRAKQLRESDVRRVGEFLSGVAAVSDHLFRDQARLRRRNTAMMSFQTINVFLNSATRLERLLQQVLEQATRLVQARRGMLLLLDDARAELKVLVSHGLDAAEVKDLRFAMGEGIPGWVAMEGVPRLLLKGAVTQLGGLDIPAEESSLCVPLIAKDMVIGVLILASPTHRINFDHDALGVASTLASQSAIAIENARLYSRLERKIGEMKAIFQLANEVNRSLDRQRVLEGVLEQSIRLLNARNGSLMLIKRDTHELYIEVANGLSREVLESTRVRLGEGVAGKVAEEGRPRLLHKGVRHTDSDVETLRELPSALSVPLTVNGMTIGVLNVSDKLTGEDFTEEELEVLSMLANQAAISIEKARLHGELQELFVSSITALANAIDARDPYTRGHSERVSRYAVRIGERLGLEGQDLEFLRYAALLHDVGKIHVKDEILQKPGKLTEEEFQKMKLHPVYGAEIIRPIKAFAKILPFIFYHHERFCALGGYPHGISGSQIPLEARIITVADSYDAMTSTRPYRKAMSVEQAIAELVRWSGTQFDPHVVDIFLQILEEDPELAQSGIVDSRNAEETGWNPTWTT